MKIAIGSDERTPFTDLLAEHLKSLGHDLLLAGPMAGETADWVDVATAVARRAASGEAECGIVLCYTGTGVSIVANKVAGCRAALCGDAKTAMGARRWNDANVLALSLRLTTMSVAKEIVAAFLETGVDDMEVPVIAKIAAAEVGQAGV